MRDAKQSCLLAAVAVGMVVAGCGSGSGRSGSGRLVTVPRNVSQLTSSHPPGLSEPGSGHPRKPAVVGPALGTSQNVVSGGAALTVTMTRLYDPLLDSGASLLAGTRAVGVVVQIDNAGPDVYDSSATGDITVVPSSGSVNPVYASAGVCKTPLQDFDSYIADGVDRSGCVAFAVRSHAKILAIRFSPHASATGRLTWRASR